MKIFKSVVILGVVFFTSCAKPPPIIEYRTKNILVPVQVPCDIKVSCDFKGVGVTPLKKLMECVISQKRALEYCKRTGEDLNDSNKN